MDDIINDWLARIEDGRPIDTLMQACSDAGRFVGLVAQSYLNLPPVGMELACPPTTNYSRGFDPEWEKEYARRNYYLDDPVVKHAFQTLQPAWWRDVEAMHADTGKYRQFFESMRKYIPGDGLVVPAFGPNNRNGIFILATGVDKKAFPVDYVQGIKIFCRAVHLKYCQLIADQKKRAGLTPREIETMEYVVQGLNSTAIAREMGLSTHTVATNLRRVFEKLDVNDRVTASLRFVALGYANP